MKTTIKILLLALVYALVGKFGLRLAIVNASATAVWPPAGIALAAYVLMGYRVWPGVLLGAFIVNASTAGTVWTSLGIACGNTLEGLIALYGINRFAHGRDVFNHPYDIFKYAVWAALLSTMVSATFGVTSLALGGFAPWARYGPIWLTWWLGDAGSIFVVAPLLILWWAYPRSTLNRKKVLETSFLFLSLIGMGLFVFGGALPASISHYPLEFLCTPIVIWAAFRLGQQEAATATFLLSAMAIWGTVQGFGPFAGMSPNSSLLLLQTYMGVVSVMGLTVAAVAAGRERARDYLEEQVQKRTAYLRESLNVLQREVDERERAERALRASEKRYQQLLKSNIVGTMVIDWEGHVFDANDAFLRMIGYTRQDLESGLVGGQDLTPPEYRAMDEWVRVKLKTSGDCPPMEKEYLRKDGTRVPVLVGVVFHEESDKHLVCLVIDASDRRKAMDALRRAYDEMETRVSERTTELAAANQELTQEVERRKRAEAALQSLAITDSLTGLYNRRGFSTLADQLLKQARRTGHPFRLFLGDLDGLKKINDTYGHLEGDHAIIAAATILKDTFRASDVIARIGGDEFAAAVLGDSDDGHEKAVLERLHEKLTAFNEKAQKGYKLDISMGTAELAADNLLSLETLLAQADATLYECKRVKQGKR